MSLTLNPNGKRTSNHHEHHHRSPLDPLINSAAKRPRTSTHFPPDTIHKQRPAIRKSLSALIPNQTNNNTPLDLLNPSNQSPTLRTTVRQHQQHHHHHQPTQPTPLKPTPTNLARPTPRERTAIKDKDELKREMAQWQEKYRVAIKSFVFYLDRLDPTTSADLKSKIRAWGARVDQFFSKEVTHIITDIPVPANIPALSPSPRKRNTAYCLPSPTRNNKENGQMSVGIRRNLKRLSVQCSPEKERSPEANIPPLIRKALELKIKIWKTEKLLNVLHRLGDQRSPLKQHQQQQQQQQSLLKPSLPSLLLKEAQQGHTNEFDPVALRSDYHYFGPKAMFIIVEDTTQEYKPIIVKEYSRPKTREASSWPIMWGGTEGKSVFSRHTAKQSYLHVRNRIRLMFETLARDSARQKKINSARERSQSLDYPSPSNRPLIDRTPPAQQQNLRRAVSMNMMQRRQSGRLSRITTATQQSEEQTTEHDPEDDECRVTDHVNQTAPDHYRGNNRVFLAASGNSISITSNVASATSTRSSAVRVSQVGRQLVDKRLAALGKRPTFEINQSNSPAGIGSSSLKREIGAESSKDRLLNLQNELESTNKLKRAQSLDSSMIAKKKAADESKAKSTRRGLGVRAKLGNGFELVDLRRLARNEEPKTGYCENCRLKYSDFRKHILTKKHRKFALDENNWIDLDDTLKKTTRRLKPGVVVPPSVREMILAMHASDDEQEEEDEVDEEEEEEDEEDHDHDQGEEEGDVEEDEEDAADDMEEKDGDDDEGVEEESEVEEEVDVRDDDDRREEIEHGSSVEEVVGEQDEEHRVEADELEEGEYDETEDGHKEQNENEEHEEGEEEEEEGQITQSNCRDPLHLSPTSNSQPQPSHHHPQYELEEGEWELDDGEPSGGNIFF
ncbi:hypothetical protein PtA15_12A579 [Puccinia triticina]|uniref:DBF4-type domain-containing protein n=1 Tax=Puccinia triticina TaxID=208348 RepID=A0ABY7CZ27_9BASI|nr:uncharacterized protein PtA15_12A579 [Puccinia triticina]WAQ90589.1 hypothetical protein PtA15_12A579 [Puccinia triticina]WAR61901.1 hypothetical protein PtB15_12B593 [Puccinia triticina]